MSERRNAAVAVTIILVLALLALALAASSCGSKTAAPQSSGSQTVNTGNDTVDNAIRELDSQMNSANPDDFGENELNDKSLGL